MKLDIIKWKDFYLSDVFTKIEPGKVSQAYQLEEGVDISLTSETAMSARISPFRTIGSLCSFIERELEDGKA